MLLVAGFAVLLGRAAWLQARAGGLALAASPRSSTARRSSCPRRAGRSSTAPASSSRSASRRRRSTPTRGRCATPARSRRPPGASSASTRRARTISSRTGSASFVYVARKADPAKAARLEKLNLAGLGFYPEERRFYPQGSVASHILGYAGLDNHGLSGLELKLDKTLAGQPGRRDADDRRARARARRGACAPRGRRAQRAPDDRPHDPGERGGGAAADDHEVACEGCDRRRARPAQRRRARDGERARLRRERLRLDAARPSRATAR